MINDYRFLCERLRKDFKKDFSFVMSIVALSIVIGVVMMFIYSYIVGVIIIAIGFIYYFMHISALRSMAKQLTNSKEIAFNGFYRYVITLLKNNHILYSALQASLEYVDEVLIDDVNILINDMENDPSLEPFMRFSSNFDDDTIKQMIILLYKTQEVGIINDVLDSINECMVHLQDTSIKNYINKEEKKIERFYMMPIILSAAVMIIISFYVFSLIGQGLYV